MNQRYGINTPLLSKLPIDVLTPPVDETTLEDQTHLLSLRTASIIQHGYRQLVNKQ